MSDESQDRAAPREDVLRRMVRRAPPPRPAAADPGGLRQVAPRIVDRVVGLSVRLGDPSEVALSRDDLGLAIPEGALLLALAAQDGSGGGLAWLGPDLFAGLVERRLTGKLRPAASEPRPATPLDAVICRELVDALCAEPGVLGSAPVRTGPHLRDPDLSVELPDVPFRLTRVRLALGRDGERGGELALALPEPPAPPAVPDGPAPARADLGGCRAEVEVTLAPFALTWAHVTTLAPGEVVTLPEGAIDGARMAGVDGRTLAAGRLGRMGEVRAVRLAVPLPTLPDEAVGEIEVAYEEAPEP